MLQLAEPEVKVAEQRTLLDASLKVTVPVAEDEVTFVLRVIVLP